MTDRGLACAVAASIVAHGLVLAFGGGLGAPANTPQRLLEARLLPEPPREKTPEKIPDKKPIEPLRPQPAAPLERAHSPRPASRPDPVVAPAPQRLVSEARPERPAPAITTAAAPAAAAAPLATANSSPATPGPAAPAAGPATSAAPAYTPPSYGASYLHNPKPGYPMIARRRGLEGVVRLDVRVSVDGVPISVKVREGSGYEALDEAALNAVWHWKFTPARRGGEAVEASFVVPIRFQLDRDEAG